MDEIANDGVNVGKAYCAEYDCYYSPYYDKWLEGNCRDEHCNFCKARPERPSMIQKALKDEVVMLKERLAQVELLLEVDNEKTKEQITQILQLLQDGANDMTNDEVVICAFRYCIGRQSYVVSNMARYLRRIWLDISVKARDLIKAEIVDAIKTENIGADMDKDCWGKMLINVLELEKRMEGI